MQLHLNNAKPLAVLDCEPRASSASRDLDDARRDLPKVELLHSLQQPNDAVTMFDQPPL